MWSLELLACQRLLRTFLQRPQGSVALFMRDPVNVCNLEPDFLISRLFTHKLASNYTQLGLSFTLYFSVVLLILWTRILGHHWTKQTKQRRSHRKLAE